MKTVLLSTPTGKAGRAIAAVMHTLSHAMTRGCLWWCGGRHGRGHWSTAGLWSQWTQEGRPVPSRTTAMTSPLCSVRTTRRLHYRWHEKSQTIRWDSFFLFYSSPMSESSVVICLHVCLMLPAVGGRALPGQSVDVGGWRGRSAAGEFREFPCSEALQHPGKWWNHPEWRVHGQKELPLLQEGPLITYLRWSNSLYFLFLRFIPFILYLCYYVMISVPPLKGFYQLCLLKVEIVSNHNLSTNKLNILFRNLSHLNYYYMLYIQSCSLYFL